MTASKTKLTIGPSKKAGEFLRVVISRSDPDDRMRWELHFNEKQAYSMAAGMLLLLPSKTVAAIFAGVSHHRPEVVEEMGRMLGRVEE